VRFSKSVLEESIPAHALLDFHHRRPADHDGATRPLRSIVLLLPFGDQVPGNHLLRLIDKHISFEFVREGLRTSYSETGRPSIDLELLLRILLIGYLCGITSERKLVEELRMHLAWRWFTGLGFDQEIPHHSTFSKNRHGRFQESKLFEQLFERIVKQCVEVGLVRGQELSVDGSFVEANAAKKSRIPREQLAEAAEVHYAVGQYLEELEQQNPVEEACMRKSRYRPPIPIPLMPPKAAPRRGWVITTTI
jgi:transposase